MEVQEILKKLETNSKECIIKDRRKGPDFLLNVINIVGFGIWGALLILIAICDTAGIKFFNINQELEEIKNINLLNVAISMTVVMFFVSAILVMVSLKRTRRRADKIRISLLISEVILFIIGILLLVKLH